MGDSKTITILFGIMLLLVVPLSLDGTVFADDDDDDDDKKLAKHHDDDDDDDKKQNTTKIIHLGYLQLAAHDFFNVDRGDRVTEASATEHENGKLDLSTVLFLPKADECDFKKSLKQKDGCALYNDADIANGGEIRSAENIMISTASAEVGEKYLELVEEYGEQKAYKKILKFYHEQIKKAYEESFHLEFPEPQEGEVTQLHNLAIRAGHDFLPAEIKFNGELTSLFAIDPLGEKLSEKEKKQQSSPVDGEFDIEFTGIDFCPIFPFFCINVDLLVADQSFGEQFGFGADRFDEFMIQQSDGIFDEEDEVSILLDQAFSRGLSFD